MPEPADDLCPRSIHLPATPTRPHTPPLVAASVWECDDPEQADRLLSGAESGYVYQRDGHPNADALAEKCRDLHAADRAIVTSSGMAALAVALLSQAAAGSHVVASRLLYGRSLHLFTSEAPRLGIICTTVDTGDVDSVAAALRPETVLVIAETISNPTLRVADVPRLASVAHAGGARLLVDNTFASPLVCRPLELGADLVMESLTKIISGHGDVMLGLLAGRADTWARIPAALTTWGMTASPFDCWLAQRGLSTLALRGDRASASALAVAQWLATDPRVERVDYPGLATHPHHALAQRQFGGRFGNMVTIHLRGAGHAARAFIAARRIPFCPSLGDLDTTLSHPASTSHRGLSAAQRAPLGIGDGTLRLSIGIESTDYIRAAIDASLGARP
jgi:cystathionine beta-lyase/cystathionine gamma-synthase